VNVQHYFPSFKHFLFATTAIRPIPKPQQRPDRAVNA
jgi:hypothetical protein